MEEVEVAEAGVGRVNIGALPVSEAPGGGTRSEENDELERETSVSRLCISRCHFWIFSEIIMCSLRISESALVSWSPPTPHLFDSSTL